MNGRTVLAIGLVGLVVLGLPPVASAQFEGVVVMTFGEGGKVAQDLTQMIKGPLVRMDMKADAAGGASMIMDGRDGTMTMVMHAQKMYMKMNLKGMVEKAQGRAGGAGKTADTPPPKITKTGQFETIAGHRCEHYLVDTDEQDTDVCLARDMGNFGLAGGAPGAFGTGGGGMAQLPPGYEQLAAEFKDGAFPLKLERVNGSTRTTLLIVKSIEAKPMEASVFQVPAGYKELQMPPR